MQEIKLKLDVEREDGEIIDISEDDIDAFLENISSEEEFTLRNRIAELEARNLELEQIASISARPYGISNINNNNNIGKY